MKKRSLSLALVVIMLLGLLPAALAEGKAQGLTPESSRGSTIENTSTHSHLVCGTAVGGVCAHAGTKHRDAASFLPLTADSDGNLCVNGVKTNTNVLPQGNYYLPEDVYLNSALTIGEADEIQTVNLCLNGKVLGLKGTVKDRVVVVSADAILTLGDCGFEKHYFAQERGSNYWKLQSDTGEHCVTGGVITGGEAPAREHGGGVRVEGCLNMFGGNIAGNNVGSSCSGGGVFVYGDAGSQLQSPSILGRFNLYGGTICYNSANNGGGVATDVSDASAGNGIFTMYAGVIEFNHAISGGGIYNYGWTVIENGAIRNNTAVGAFGMGGGGGIYQGGNMLILNDGSITDNTSDRGGGVFATKALAVNGGTISGNIANTKGSGNALYANKCEVNLTGSTEITGSGGAALKTFNATVGISGGTYDFDPGAYVPEGYSVTKIDGGYAVTASDAPPTAVAEIGSEKYTSLQKAVNAATNNVQTTVALLADTREHLEIGTGQNVVLDLGGKSVDGTVIVKTGAAVSFTGGGAVNALTVEDGFASVAKAAGITLPAPDSYTWSGTDPQQLTSPVAAALTAVDGVVYANVGQSERYDTAEELKNYVKGIAVSAVNNSEVTVSVRQAAAGGFFKGSPGDDQNPDGVDGYYKFTVTVGIGARSKTTGEKTVYIKYVKSDDAGVTSVKVADVAVEGWTEQSGTMVAAVEVPYGTVLNESSIAITPARRASVSNKAYSDGNKKFSFAVMSENGQVVKNYEVTVTFAAPDEYAVTLGSVGGGSIAIDEGQMVAQDAEVTITATPETGYQLEALSVYKTGDDTVLVSVVNNKFTMPAFDVTVSARFGKTQAALDSDVLAALADVNGAPYPAAVTMEQMNTVQALHAAVYKIAEDAVSVEGVTLTVTDISFAAAVAGSAGNLEGTKGGYTFRITVSKGEQCQTTGVKRVEITAAACSAPPATALDTAKAAAKSELAGYKNMADYRAAQQLRLVQLVSTGCAAIDEAISVENVNALLAAYKAAMDAVKTHAQLAWEEMQYPIFPDDPAIDTADPDDVPEEIEVEHPFTDVPAGEWYSAGVQYVYAHGLMNGLEDTAFGWDKPANRAMIWTILARLSGVDTSTGVTWDAVGREWAIASGVSDGSASQRDISREELVTMLWRFAENPEVDAFELGELSAYPDGMNVSSWAQRAMAWALSVGIINGVDGTLSPQAGASRAAVATILMRFCENSK